MKIKFFNVVIFTLAFIMNIRTHIVKGSLLKSLLTNENLPIEHAQKNLLIQSQRVEELNDRLKNIEKKKED